MNINEYHNPPQFFGVAGAREVFIQRRAGSCVAIASGGGEAHPSDIHWSIAKQSSVAKLNRVDFWSKPLGGIKYADELPSEIGRGALFYGEAASRWRNRP